MSTAQVHDAGRFNRQLSIENLVKIPDECGGFIKQYVIDGAVWAHLCPENTSLRIFGEQELQETSHKILMRFRNGIKRGTRFLTGSRKFEVVSVRDVDESRRYLECMVIER